VFAGVIMVLGAISVRFVKDEKQEKEAVTEAQ
jgi:hypothetical protein